MAKVSFTQLKRKIEDNKKTFVWNEKTIEVKQYLGLNDKLNLISEVINKSTDENTFYNPGKVDFFMQMAIVDYYTNITFTDKQKDELDKVFDNMVQSGLMQCIIKHIPEEERDYLFDLLDRSIDSVYAYRTSALGVIDTISQDYNVTDFKAEELMKKLANKENIELVSEITGKLG